MPQIAGGHPTAAAAAGSIHDNAVRPLPLAVLKQHVIADANARAQQNPNPASAAVAAVHSAPPPLHNLPPSAPGSGSV